MRFRTELDVASDETVASLFARLEPAGARIIAFESSGPAGGNPCAVIENNDRPALEALLRGHHGEGEPDWWIASLIRPA